MEFNEMKKIWDTQNNEYIYAIDHNTLHSKVIKNSIKAKRKLNIFELTMIITMFFLTALYLIGGLLNNKIYHVSEGLLFFIVFIYLLKMRIDRKKHQALSDNSLLDDIKMTIHTLDYHGKLQNKAIFLVVIPIVLVALFHLISNFDSKPWYHWIFAFGGIGISYFMLKKELKCKIYPKKEEMEKLYKLLSEN